MADEQIKDLMKEITIEFKKLKNFLFKWYRQKDSADIKKLENLFKGLKHWSRNPRETPFVSPTKILDLKSKTNKAKLTSKELNAIAAAKLRLLEAMYQSPEKSFYKTVGKNSNIIFTIESAQKDGKYRLKALIDDKDFVDIVRETKDRGYAKLKLALSTQEQNYFLDKYLKQVENEHRYLDINYLGIMPFRKNAIELAEAYIKLKVTEGVSSSEASHLTEHSEWLSGVPENVVKEKKIIKKTTAHPVLFEDILQNVLMEKDVPKRNIVVLGPPGSGKTTLLSYLAYSVATGRAEDWGLNGFIPIYVNLPEYAHSGSTDLLQYALTKATVGIVGDSQKKELQKALERIINQCRNDTDGEGRTIFLLDALDEIKFDKKSIITAIKRLSSMYKKAIIVLTSRIVNYYEATLPGFDHYLLEDLEINDINNFIRIWFRIFAKERNLEGSEKDWSDWAYNQSNYLIHQINSKPNLKRLASLPLYLSFMLYLGSDPETDIPETRSIIYRKYFDKLIINWQKKYGLPFSPDDLFEGFINICWIIHRALYGDIKNDTTINFVKKSIRSLTDANADQLIDFWIKSGVLLTVKTKHQDELLLPRHLSFLEYGFACKLASMWDSELIIDGVWNDLKKNIHNQHLSEPLFLFINIIEDPGSFIEHAFEIKDDLFHTKLILLSKLFHEVFNRLHNQEFQRKLSRKLIELLESSDYFTKQIKRDIFNSLCLTGNVKGLSEMLDTEADFSKRLEIIKAITTKGDRNAVPFLKELFEKEKSPPLKNIIISNINEICGGKATISYLKQLFERENRTIAKSSIVRCFEEVKDKDNTIPLLKDLFEKETDLKIMCELAISIGKIGDKQLSTSLLKQVYEKETTAIVRSDIIRLLGGLGDKTAIPFLKNCFDKQTNISNKIDIAKTVGKLGDLKLANSFFKKVFEKDPKIIAKLDFYSTIDYLEGRSLSSLLKKIYNKENEPTVRSEIIKYLGKLSGEAALPYLKDLFRKEKESFVKKQIARSICEVSNKKTLPLLRELFEKETDDKIKTMFAIKIGKLGDSKLTVLYLENKLKNQGDAREKAEIFRNFGELGDKSAIPLLKDLFGKEKNQKVRFAIATTIGVLGDRKSAISYLQQVYEKETVAFFKLKIANQFGRFEDINAIPILKQLFEREVDPDVRSVLVDNIGWIGDDSTITILKQLFKKENDSNVRSRIASCFSDVADKTIISYLKQLFEKETNSSVKYEIARSIYSIANRERVLVYEDEQGQVHLEEITTQYSF